MPPDPTSLSIEYRTSAAWRFGTAALTAAAALGLGWWGVSVLQRGAPGRIWLGLPAVLALAAAASMGRMRAGHLHWDGELWQLTEAAPGDEVGYPGALDVALDGGHWMLLRFRATESRPGRGVQWLALSRRDLGSEWQALRCAVYSPRSDPAGRSAQAPAAPSA